MTANLAKICGAQVSTAQLGASHDCTALCTLPWWRRRAAFREVTASPAQLQGEEDEGTPVQVVQVKVQGAGAGEQAVHNGS